jgi:hypothetical protein
MTNITRNHSLPLINHPCKLITNPSSASLHHHPSITATKPPQTHVLCLTALTKPTSPIQSIITITVSIHHHTNAITHSIHSDLPGSTQSTIPPLLQINITIFPKPATSQQRPKTTMASAPQNQTKLTFTAISYASASISSTMTTGP